MRVVIHHNRDGDPVTQVKHFDPVDGADLASSFAGILHPAEVERILKINRALDAQQKKAEPCSRSKSSPKLKT